jgi:thiamine pyrophosphokinase
MDRMDVASGIIEHLNIYILLDPLPPVLLKRVFLTSKFVKLKHNRQPCYSSSYPKKNLLPNKPLACGREVEGGRSEILTVGSGFPLTSLSFLNASWNILVFAAKLGFPRAISNEFNSHCRISK